MSTPSCAEPGAKTGSRRFCSSFSTWGSYRDYLRAKPNDDFDNAGIDFVIYLGDETIPLQVKSSYKGVEEHFRQHGRNIPCVVVSDYRDDGKLMSELFQTTGLDKLLVA